MPTARRRKPTKNPEFPPLQPIYLSDLENSLKLTRNPPKKANASPFSKEMIRRNVTFLVRAENCLDVSAKIDDILSQSPLKPPKTATRELFAGLYKHFRPDYPSPAEAKALKEKARLEKEKDEYFDELLKEWERTTMLAGQAAPPVIAWVEQRGHDPMVIRRLLAALEHPGGFTAHGRGLLSDLEALFDTIFSGKPSWLSARRLRRQTRKKGAGDSASLLKKGKVRWDDDAEGYVSGKDAIKLSDGALDYRKLNTLLKPKGEIRYMRKGRRCRVHVNDLKITLEHRAGTQDFSEQAAGAFARYQEEFAKKHDRK